MALASLPAELLLDIFGYLTYEDIKLGVIPSCKRFQSLISHEKTGKGAIDVVLFRDLPAASATHPEIDSDNDCIQLDVRAHPVFKRLVCENDSALDEILLRGPHNVRLIDSPIAHENAVSPARFSAEIHGPHHQDIESSSDPGVCAATVLEVMDSFVRTFAKEMGTEGLSLGRGLAIRYRWEGVKPINIGSPAAGIRIYMVDVRTARKTGYRT